MKSGWSVTFETDKTTIRGPRGGRIISGMMDSWGFKVTTVNREKQIARVYKGAKVEQQNVGACVLNAAYVGEEEDRTVRADRSMAALGESLGMIGLCEVFPTDNSGAGW